MKLYYSPGACSLAPHIVLRESGAEFELERVDLRTHTTSDGGDYYKVNPKGAVPLLQTRSGLRLTEGPIICQYIADQAGNTELMPACGSEERYRVMEWQNYITSELHKSYSTLFMPVFDNAAKTTVRGLLRKKYEWIEKELATGPYLTGNRFTAADAYLFTVTQWARKLEVDLDGLPNIARFDEQVKSRPTVREALDVEAGRKQ